MKIFVIGGTSGIGKEIADYLSADAIGRETDIQNDSFLGICDKYDLIINCLPTEYQFDLTVKIFNHLESIKKKANIISFGSTGYRSADSNHWKKQLYDWNDKLTITPTTVNHTLLNISWAWNSSDSCPIKKLTKEDINSLVDIILNSIGKFHISEITVRGIPF